MARRAFLAGILLALAAGAGEREDYLATARLAMEAKLKEGDALLAAGDRAGALRAYEDAVALFRDAERRFRGAGPATDSERDAPTAAEESLARALRWLAAHQDVAESGAWDCDGFMKHDPAWRRSTGAGNGRYDVGVTGLALLAFLEAGHRPGTPPFGENVRMGLAYLKASQDADGCIGSRETNRHFLHNHGAATAAIGEALRLTGDAALREPAQRALEFIAKARNPELAWRYGIRPGENDSSVTGWMLLALDAGRRAGLEVDAKAFDGARVWIEKMTDPATGQGGYLQRGGGSARPEGRIATFPSDLTEAMTASLLVSRLHCGENPRSPMMVKGADLLERLPPNWYGGSIDMYYWFFGSRALSAVGGRSWKVWREALVAMLPVNQGEDGSFDPVDPWGDDGGRVYSTAMCALTLHRAASVGDGPARD